MQSAIDIANAAGESEIGSLGKMLFPDPSKAALGYYYGAKSREAQLEGYKLIGQQNETARLSEQLANPNAPAPERSYFQPPLQNAPMMVPAPFTPHPQAAAAASQDPAGAGRIASQAIQPAVDRYNTQRATPLPPFGAPAPGASPQTPNTTGTDGSVVGVQTPLHPGSITDPNGGPKFAPPASGNGSPAQPAVTLGTVMGAGVGTGMDAARLQAAGQAFIVQAVKDGRMDEATGRMMLAGAGQPAPYTTAMHETAETGRTVMTVGEQARQFNLHPEMTVDPATGKPVYTQRSQVFGKEPFDPATSAFGPAINPEAPNAPPVLMRPQQAQIKGYTPAAASQEQQRAQLEQQWRLMPEGPEKDKVYQQLIAIAATPSGEIDPAKQAQQKLNDYRSVQTRYAPPQAGVTKLAIKEPGALRTDAQDLVNARADQLKRQPFYKTHPDRAFDKALEDAVANGEIESPDQVSAKRQGQLLSTASGLRTDPRLAVVQPPVKGATPTNHMMISLTPKGREAAQSLGLPVGGAAPAPNAAGAGTDAGGGTATGTATTTGTATATPAPTTALSPGQMYGQTTPGATPVPSVGARLSEVIGGLGAATNPTPLGPGQMYGSTPMAPALPAAPAAGNTLAQQMYGGVPRPAAGPAPAPAPAAAQPPPGALGPARAGDPDGTPVITNTGQRGIVRGGWVLPR